MDTFPRQKITGVYLIINTITYNIYIGSSVDMCKRMRVHFRTLRKNKHHSRYLQRAFNKYGEENFKWFILTRLCEKTISKNCILSKEQMWIDKLKPEYNIRKIADSNLGIKLSDETKEKLRVSHLGKKMPLTTRIAIKNANTGRKVPYKPQNISSEVREQRRVSMLGNKLSVGRKPSAKNIAINKARLTGTKISDHIKNKISDKNSIPVLQYSLSGDLIKEWKSARMAYKELNISYKNICSVCKGKRNKAGGFIWKYKSKINAKS